MHKYVIKLTFQRQHLNLKKNLLQYKECKNLKVLQFIFLSSFLSQTQTNIQKHTMLETNNRKNQIQENLVQEMEVQSTQMTLNVEAICKKSKQDYGVGQAQKQADNLISAMLKGSGQGLLENMKRMVLLAKEGYSQLFVKNMTLMKRLMDEFQRTFKSVEDQESDQKSEYTMIYLLSVFAQLMRQNPLTSLPLTKKFIISVLRIDSTLLEGAPRKNDILAILAVLYENFSRHPKTKVPALQANLKKSLLENYSLIEELFTLKVFNKALYNLSARGVELTTAEFSKYKVLETVSGFFTQSQLESFIKKINNRLVIGVASKNEKHPSSSY